MDQFIIDLFFFSLPVLLWILALAIPLFYLLGKTGKSRWWFVMAFVPILGVTVLLWIVTFSRWPMATQTEREVS
ncbi:MAG: hypothetical protein V3T76_06035 [candidate division NC10 bacterium]